jgi:hypothetical protein
VREEVVRRDDDGGTTKACAVVANRQLKAMNFIGDG